MAIIVRLAVTPENRLVAGISEFLQWTLIDEVAQRLRHDSPQSFRHYCIRQRNGKVQEIWAFSKVLRLKTIGRKRIVLIHETEDLSDTP